jgi:hypothetical protein
MENKTPKTQQYSHFHGKSASTPTICTKLHMSGGHQRTENPDGRFYVSKPALIAGHILPYPGPTMMPDMTHTPPMGV